MPHRLLEMQRAAGNQAVTWWLDLRPPAGVQRAVWRSAESDGLPLDATQVASAIRYYARRRRRFTSEIVGQIQEAIGVPASGQVDATTVQAVARWQRDEGHGDQRLFPDGKAGPRTLPQMFRSGLNVRARGRDFGEAAQSEVVDRWGELSVNQRSQGLLRLANQALGEVDVPPVEQEPILTDLAGAGKFDTKDWVLEIDLETLDEPELTRDDATDLIDTVYHEARHAEQVFRIAQMRAGRGRSARGIVRDMNEEIPRAIAELATERPLARGSTEALIAQGWYEESIAFGPGRRRLLEELERLKRALREAEERYRSDPTPENEARLEAAKQAAVDAYHRRPMEHDAAATGSLTGGGATQDAHD